MGTQEKLEKKVISYFYENFQTFQNTTNDLIVLGHYDIALEYFSDFSNLCSEIQQDPRFLYMDKFIKLVKDTENKISEQIEELEANWTNFVAQQGNFKSKKNDYGIGAKNQFYRQIDQIQKEFLDSVKDIPANEFEHYLNKSNFFSKPRIIRKFSPSQEKIIKNFRNQATKEKILSFNKRLTNFQELKLFDEYRLAIEYNLVDFEDKGWFNTIRMYIREWIPYLETLEAFHARNARSYLSKKIRKEIDKINAWVLKVDQKYDKSIKLNVDQAVLMDNSIKKMISIYKNERKQLKRYEKDKRILKYLKNNSVNPNS
ncbi:hypothetical protein [Candidatus Lokiarchaeum ossiferum]|uniref:hypothetical protein n=1 Tax=Candidatus Lokiarchaeum ossiferum TaxID=2951803 RepID=UPI00352D4781